MGRSRGIDKGTGMGLCINTSISIDTGLDIMYMSMPICVIMLMPVSMILSRTMSKCFV